MAALSASRSRCCLGSGVVPALGPHHQLAVTLGFRVHADLPKTTAGSRIRWLISNGVLIPDVVRHLPADLIHFVQRLRKKRQASGPLRDNLQRMLGSLGLLFVP